MITRFALWILTGLALGLPACSPNATGVCNACFSSNFSSDACFQQAAANHCADAGVRPTTECGGDGGALSCVYTGCDKPLNCSLITGY